MTAEPSRVRRDQSFPELDRIRRAVFQAGLSGGLIRPAINRRREERLSVMASGSCLIEGQFDLEPIVIKNISSRGMQFQIRKLLKVGDRIRVIICLPGTAPCQLTMDVRWVGKTDSSVHKYYRVGAALLERLSPI